MPRWRIYIIQNFENNKSAIILKFHHEISDGIGLCSLFFHILALDAEQANHLYDIKLNKPSYFEFLWRTIFSLLIFWKIYYDYLIAYKADINKFHPKK